MLNLFLYLLSIYFTCLLSYVHEKIELNTSIVICNSESVFPNNKHGKQISFLNMLYNGMHHLFWYLSFVRKAI